MSAHSRTPTDAAPVATMPRINQLAPAVDALITEGRTTLGAATFATIALVSLPAPFQDQVYFDLWLAFPAILHSAIVPVLLALAGLVLFRGLRDGHDRTPFLASVGLVLVSSIGIGISVYPMMVPPGLTIAEAAAPDSSLALARVGTVVLALMILVDTAYANRVFLGKIDPDAGYC